MDTRAAIFRADGTEKVAGSTSSMRKRTVGRGSARSESYRSVRPRGTPRDWYDTSACASSRAPEPSSTEELPCTSALHSLQVLSSVSSKSFARGQVTKCQLELRMP